MNLKKEKDSIEVDENHKSLRYNGITIDSVATENKIMSYERESECKKGVNDLTFKIDCELVGEQLKLNRKCSDIEVNIESKRGEIVTKRTETHFIEFQNVSNVTEQVHSNLVVENNVTENLYNINPDDILPDANLKNTFEDKSDAAVALNGQAQYSSQNISKILIDDLKCSVLSDDIEIAHESLFSVDECDRKTSINAVQCFINKKYECFSCKKVFKRIDNFKRHMKTHSLEEHTCAACHQKFSCVELLLSHCKVHTQETVPCELCGKIFSSNRNLKLHCLTHTDGSLYKCQECEKTFFRKSFLDKHCAVHSKEEKITCELCQKSFDHCNCQTHTEELPYICNTCQETFTTYQTLRRHIKIHTNKKSENKIKCPECSAFLCKNSLINHLKTHTNEKSYICDLCCKSFRSNYHLKMHRMSHSKEESYVCDICNKKFKYPKSLHAHKKIHENKKPYSCELCDGKFSFQSSLKVHYRIHTNERPYICDVCQKSFLRHSHLDRHYRIHTQEKPYVCTICHKGFTVGWSLKGHMKTHEVKEKCQCVVCQKLYGPSLKKRKNTNIKKPFLAK